MKLVPGWSSGLTSLALLSSSSYVTSPRHDDCGNHAETGWETQRSHIFIRLLLPQPITLRKLIKYFTQLKLPVKLNQPIFFFFGLFLDYNFITSLLSFFCSQTLVYYLPALKINGLFFFIRDYYSNGYMYQTLLYLRHGGVKIVKSQRIREIAVKLCLLVK